ncbi:MAG: hypothetical protein U9N60_03010 [Thermodesulfobacteriota bacterium]|nr:hypothetical protein [Thermodesulfobacteriota bacterium]
MPGWKEILLDMLKLTDEVKRMNREIERLESHVVGVDKRVVRLETIIEIAQLKPKQIEQKGGVLK